MSTNNVVKCNMCETKFEYKNRFWLQPHTAFCSMKCLDEYRKENSKNDDTEYTTYQRKNNHLSYGGGSGHDCC